MSRKAGDHQGSLSPAQMESVLAALPCDLSFADENDVLLYWKGPTYSTCSPRFIGRDVRDCHPGHTMDVLEEILREFKSGARDKAEGWRQDGERFKYTCYLAVRDHDGIYRGILEINHDLTRLRGLEGKQQLPGW